MVAAAQAPTAAEVHDVYSYQDREQQAVQVQRLEQARAPVGKDTVSGCWVSGAACGLQAPFADTCTTCKHQFRGLTGTPKPSMDRFRIANPNYTRNIRSSQS